MNIDTEIKLDAFREWQNERFFPDGKGSGAMPLSVKNGEDMLELINLMAEELGPVRPKHEVEGEIVRKILTMGEKSLHPHGFEKLTDALKEICSNRCIHVFCGVTVASDVEASEANYKYGDRYGKDWAYEGEQRCLGGQA